MGNPSLPSLKHKRHSQVGAGPLWVGKGKSFGGLLFVSVLDDLEKKEK